MTIEILKALPAPDEPMATGLYKIDDADYYVQIPNAINHSTLSNLQESPRKCRLELDGILKRKKRCLALGILAHWIIFEMPDEDVERFLSLTPPFDLGDRIVVCPDSIPGTEWQANCAAFKGSKTVVGWKNEQEDMGKQVFRLKEFKEALEKREGFEDHPDIAAWRGFGDTEVTAIWDDSEVGRLCIGRLDWLVLGHDDSGKKIACLLDLKGVGEIAKADSKYEWLKWYRQLGFYRNALRIILGDEWEVRVRIIVQDGEEPYDCFILTPDTDDLDNGLLEAQDLIRQFHVHQKLDWWPRPPDRPVSLKGQGGFTYAQTRHMESQNRFMGQLRAHCAAQKLPVPDTIEEALGMDDKEVAE